MNIPRILELADIIEAQPHTSYEADHGFHMDAMFHSCGTPCCIAGWVSHIWKGSAGQYISPERSLGLTGQTAGGLFSPFALDWGRITPAVAAATLRHLAETGEVDFARFIAKEAA